MGLQDPPASQDSGVSWVSLDSEEREACWECQVLLYVFFQTLIIHCLNLVE